MDDQASALAAVLISAQGRDAVASGRSGTIIRLARRVHGWSQQQLADRSGYSQATISRVERGRSRAVRDTAMLVDLAETLGLPLAALGLAGHGPAAARTLDDVHRRDFLGAVGLATAALLPNTVASAAARIDADEAIRCWTSLRRLFELDDQAGGSTVYRLAASMASQLQEALIRGSYTPTVGHELQRVTAATMELAGWLAYDAGWPETARHWWLETCHLADMADIPDARVTALVSMSLQAGQDPARGRETIALVQAARNAATGDSSPTLLSLLAAREAIGHARNNDRAAAMSSITNARRWLDMGKQRDEPLWLDFWGPADLACHETRVALAIGNGRSAESSARVALANADAKSYPRNHTIYAVRLGATLTQLGQLDEAVAVISEAIQRVGTVHGSRRIVGELHRTVSMLDRQHYAPARTFAAAARRLLPAVP